MRHWNPVVSPVPVNSTVTLLFLPTIACPLIPTTTQNLESVRTRILFWMTALSFLTGSTATTRSTWSPAGRPVRLKKPEVPGVGGERGREWEMEGEGGRGKEREVGGGRGKTKGEWGEKGKGRGRKWDILYLTMIIIWVNRDSWTAKSRETR